MSNMVKGGTAIPPEILEKVVVNGDLSQLDAKQRMIWYKYRCDQAGLNHANQPFQYIILDGRLILYATKAATDQLRSNNNISISIVHAAQEGEMFRVVARATDSTGRQDEDVAVVKLPPSGSQAHANAIMKCYTKAKRRVTLSFCGLGMLDETEVEGIPESRAIKVNSETGEIIEDIPIAQGMQHKPKTNYELITEASKKYEYTKDEIKEYCRVVLGIQVSTQKDINSMEPLHVAKLLDAMQNNSLAEEIILSEETETTTNE